MEAAALIVFAVLAYIIYVNSREDKIKRQAREELLKDPNQIPDALLTLIEEKKKIEAIQEYRAIYGAGLKEASEFVNRQLADENESL